jgi:caffeoyl-CoA O-methyltransferase
MLGFVFKVNNAYNEGGIFVSKLVLSVIIVPCIFLAAILSIGLAEVGDLSASRNIDDRVRQVIDSHRGSWGGPNVPKVDGQALYDIVLQHGYKNALEIGTSNGYSGLWIAWALSKTGGKLITIEIDRGGYEEALAYFREAGLAEYVDARLGDAHDLVPALPGPFDFVFCDADKDWYKNYLEAVVPKLTVRGCFAAHNVSEGSYLGGYGGRGSAGFRGGFRRGYGAGDFLQYARSFPNLETKVLELQGSAGLSVSYKVAEK